MADALTEKLQAMRLERARCELVAKYRDNPRLWPDGIDTKFDRWYTGKEGEWTADRVAAGLAMKEWGVNKDPSVVNNFGTDVNTEGGDVNKSKDRGVYMREYMKEWRKKHPKKPLAK